MKYIQAYRGFTLVEILAGVTIVTTVTLGAFYGINAIWFGKVKLIEKTNLEQQAFFFSERVFELIKQSGTIDYEEYFNRQIVGDTTYLSGHYERVSGFWNRSTDLIYCLSGNIDPMGNSGCITDYNTTGWDITGTSLIYGQYASQFVDYNSDADGDGWDEDTDGDFIWDDDDKFLGNGPSAVAGNGSVREIYLINGDKTERTFFRRNVSIDPDAPSGTDCDFSDQSNPSWEACLWTIEFLRLKWVDWGHDHVLGSLDKTENDGVIDTWVYSADTYGLADDLVADFPFLDSESYWLPVFTDEIDVESLEVLLHPSKDSTLAWADSDQTTFVSPYMRIAMKLSPSWKQKRKIQWDPPEVEIRTTINLSPNTN